MEQTSEQRQALESKIVRHLLDTAIAAGWAAPRVDDGGDTLVKCATVDDAMEAIFSVDDASIYFKKPGVPGMIWVSIVLGNGIDCISDYTVNLTFEREVMGISNAFVESLDQ